MKKDGAGQTPLDAPQAERLTDFFHEVGMLRHTPRSGYAFLGSGKESVAEHSYRVAVMGYALARLGGLDPARVTFLCLFHDLHEARTGDLNYVNHRYGSLDARAALEDCVRGTGLEGDILPLWEELSAAGSPEAQLAHDADQLDLICNLKVELERGNAFAARWLESAVARLQTPLGRQVAETVLRTDSSRWWYGQVDPDWWVRRGRQERQER